MHKVIILGFPLLFLLVVDSFQWEKHLRGVCERVIDGDTIQLAGRRVRLEGIDAPELNQFSLDKLPIGVMSRNFLKQRIEGKKILVQYRKKDRYGRLLGRLYQQGEDINRLMIQQGWAVVYRDQSLLPVQYVARLKRQGIYQSFGFMHPAIFRKKKAARRQLDKNKISKEF